jgi:hypothetical protein
MTGPRWTLQGARALVVGGTRGIGRATADELLALGAQVLVVGRDEQGIDNTRAEWARHGALGEAVAADVATAEGRKVLAYAVGTRWSGLDILVNNVGLGLRKPFVEHTDDDLASLVDLNFMATVKVSRDLFSLLRQGTNAAVVNVGSCVRAGDRQADGRQSVLPQLRARAGRGRHRHRRPASRGGGDDRTHQRPVSTRNEKRKALVALLQELRGHLQSTADAEEANGPAIIESAGVALRNTPTRRAGVFAANPGRVSGVATVVSGDGAGG